MVKIGDIELGKFPLLLAPMEDVSDPPFRALLFSEILILITQLLIIFFTYRQVAKDLVEQINFIARSSEYVDAKSGIKLH